MEMQDGSVVSFRKSGITKISDSALICCETVTVLPYSNSVIPCNIINRKPSNHVLCISDTGLLAEKHGIMMPYCVFNTNLQTPHIRVIKPRLEHVTLHQGARITFIEDCEVVTAPRISGLRFNAMQQSRGVPALSLIAVNSDGDYLSVQQRQQMQNIMNNFSDIFAVDGQRTGRTSLIEQRIDLHPDTKPFKLLARRLRMHLQGELDQELDSFLEQQIIEHSESDVSSPPVLVPKKYCSIRF